MVSQRAVSLSDGQDSTAVHTLDVTRPKLLTRRKIRYRGRVAYPLLLRSVPALPSGGNMYGQLALAVAAVQKLRKSTGLSFIFRFKELDNVSGDIHPAGGIYPRRDAKADVIAGHFIAAFSDLH